MATINLTGASGTKYDFGVHDLDGSFHAVAGVYTVTERYETARGRHKHTVIYFGQTSDLGDRFDDHHKADCFAVHNANSLCFHADDDEQSRLAKENDLIEAHYSPCNN